MTHQIVAQLIELLKWLGGGVLVVWASLEGYAKYLRNKREVAEIEAKEKSVGDTAIKKINADLQAVRNDIDELGEAFEKSRKEIYDDKERVSMKFEKLRDHFDDMYEKYVKIFQNK